MGTIRKENVRAAGGFFATGMMLGLTSLLVLLAGTGCATGGGDAGTMVVENLPDGYVRVTHQRLPSTILNADTLAAWDLWADGNDYMFNRIAGVCGSDDHFLLMDGGNAQVVEVDLQGRPVRHFGRRGEGPGEFNFPYYLAVAGGKVWVSDPGNQRLSVFDRSGAYERDYRLEQYMWFLDGFVPLQDGRILSALQRNGDFESPDAVTMYHTLVLDLTDGSSDTLLTMESLPSQRIEIAAETGQGMVFFGPPRFAPELHWAWAPDGRIWTASAKDYLLEARDLDGTLLLQIAAPSPDLTVTERERRWFFEEEGLAFGFGSGERFQATRASLEKYPFAERRQAVGGLNVDPFGRIWVEAATADPGAHRLDLFAPDGSYLGNLGAMPMPAAFTAGGDALLRVEDEDGIEQFYVIAVPEQGEGA